MATIKTTSKTVLYFGSLCFRTSQTQVAPRRVTGQIAPREVVALVTIAVRCQAVTPTAIYNLRI